MREKERHKDSSSSQSIGVTSPTRDKIWSVKLPGKVRVFLWRLAHNSLPLRLNVKRKKVELDTLCPMCNRLDEDGGHLFFRCKGLKKLWRNSAAGQCQRRIDDLPRSSSCTAADHAGTL